MALNKLFKWFGKKKEPEIRDWPEIHISKVDGSWSVNSNDFLHSKRFHKQLQEFGKVLDHFQGSGSRH